MPDNTVVHCTTARIPIAIIGIGCCFPGGGNTHEEFWKMLLQKKNGIKPIPADRWNADAFYHPDFNTKGKMQVKQGGFIEEIDMFDAQFFGIAPVEAQRMDPQQRLLLEQTYYALEDAGLTIEDMAGSRTGVFVGISSSDYAGIQNSYTDRANIGAQTNSGGAASIAANRISYFFDLKGPSFAVDTACSSSLVATHIACRSILQQDADMAIVGGVNLLLRPEVHIGFSNGGFLSPDCRCKTFDAEANGYVRSEGAGVIILKPLDKAIADRNHIYATIIGSALNEDGHTGGIFMPNPEAQVDVLQRAYQDADIDPRRVDYIEAHGTGTAVGDPIECNSIAAVLGGEKKLLVGSVKSNIGHLEPASGMAGIIKTAMAVKYRKVPPNINFKKPNPKIDFAAWNIAVPTKTEPLGEKGKTITAGINSFGFGGANAHIVLQSYDQINKTRKKIDTAVTPLFLSARSENALKELAGAYRKILNKNEVNLSDFCYSAARSRSPLEIRASLPAMNRTSTCKLLSELASGREHPLIARGRKAENGTGKTAFVFSGQGPQWYAMGRELLKSNKVFRQAVDEIDHILNRLGWLRKEKSSLIKELQKSEKNSRIDQTEIAQPAIFAIQIGLTRIWKSLGIAPDGIIGHSIGEVAAGWAAGALSLEEATRLVYWRSRCQAPAAGKGKMMAVGLSYDDAVAKLIDYADKIDIAAVNGPEMLTLAGETKALEKLARVLEAENIFNRFLIVDVPFHSFMLDDIIEDFKKSIKNIKNKQHEIEIFSTVTGKPIDGKQMTTAYWAKNIRQSVLFYPAISAMVQQGYENFVEISPHPILAHGINAALQNAGRKGIVTGSLRRKEAEMPFLLSSLGKLFCSGVNLDFKKLFAGDFQYIKLPHYPWQRERYWLESKESLRWREGTRVHPHLTDKIWHPKEPGTVVWNLELDSRTHPYINDHRVQGPLVYPGAGHVDLALGVAVSSFSKNFGFLEDIEFMEPLFLPEDGEPYPCQISVTADEGEYVISTRRTDNEQDWIIHSKGRINHIGDSFNHRQVDLEKLRKRIDKTVEIKPLFDVLEKGGLMLGPTFKGLTHLWHAKGESLGKIEIHKNIRHDCADYKIHPALLDASFQTAFGIISGTDYEGVYIPIKIKRLKFYRTPTSTIFSYAKAASYTDDIISADLWIMDENGELLLEIQGFTAKYLKGSRGEVQGQLDDFFYKVEWLRKDRADLLTQRRSGEFMLRPSEYLIVLQKQLSDIKKQNKFEQFIKFFSPFIENIALSYMLEMVKETGFETGKIATKHRPLFARIVEHLQQNKIIDNENGKLKIIKSDLPCSNDLTAEAEAKFKDFMPELAMLKLCGPELTKIIKGKKDPIELLFSQENRNILTDYYSEAFTFDRYHQVLAQAVDKLLENIPEYQTLRVLEIGAGTGGITKMVIPLFPANRTEYFFTDISYEFMARAKERFDEYRFIEYRAFDVTKDIEDQHFIPGSYDLVIASNVIHSTADVMASLHRIRNLLTDGGVLMMLEVTHTNMYPDLIFGLTEGWWNYLQDPLQRERCTLSSNQWEKALTEAHFGEVISLSDIDDHMKNVPVQNIFIAQADIRNKLPDKLKTDPGRWLIIADNQGISQSIADQLLKAGHNVKLISLNKFSALRDLSVFDNQASNSANLPFHGVVYTAAVDAPELYDLSDDDIKQSQMDFIFPLLETARELEKHPAAKSLKLWIVTTEAVNAFETDKINIQQTPLLGLGRVIINEVNSFQTRLVDISINIDDREVAQLVDEMTSMSSELTEEEIIFRANKRFVRRLNRYRSPQRIKAAMRKLPASGSEYHLEPGMNGLIEELKLQVVEYHQLQSDEVSIEVKYSSLNFRDVMLATGVLPDEALNGGIFGRHFGLECSGTVTGIGNKVKGFEIGDQVMAVARDCLAGKVHAKADFTIKIPQGISCHEAVALPMAYLTAYYSLIKVANLSSGEKVLIHAASGGVGLAAVNIAKKIGAEIFATSSQEKQSFLHDCGVENIYDSRTPLFYDQIMRDTEQQGVDVVLNSLSGDLLTQSLKTLAPGGRFIEIGKNDIYNNKRIGLELLADNCSYSIVDIDRLMVLNPAVVNECLHNVFAARSSFYQPDSQFIKHPLTIKKTADFASALRYMAQSKHLGKVILEMSGEVMVNPPKQLRFDCKATYLIAGGTGGLGLAVGKFLAKNGAGHIVLASRRGKVRQDENKILAEIKELGTKVSIFSVDISQRSDVQQVIRKIDSNNYPLKGVFQSTMVLADGVLGMMSWEQFFTPLESKIQGTWNLHLATEKLKLDYFVSFSSIVSIYGTPGQANYAAANSFLDSFAYFRHSKNLPATTVNWGAIADMGYVARNRTIRNFLNNHGWTPVSLNNVFSSLEKAMLAGETQVGIFDVDWNAFAETFPGNATSGRFSHLLNDSGKQISNGDEESGFTERLQAAKVGERESIAHEVLQNMLAKILGLNKNKIDVQTPLTRMGIDSLMANQIRSWLTKQTGVAFSLMQIMQGPTLSEIAATILTSMNNELDTDEPSTNKSPWLIIPKHIKQPRKRLFCFPYMGVGVSIYNGWHKLLPDDVELILVQLPGREERIDEAPLFDTRILFKQLAKEMLPLCDIPYAFYGHSFGGNIAMSFATYLDGMHESCPRHLFIGAAIPPSVSNPLEKDFALADKPSDSQLDEKSLIELLRKLGNPESVLEDKSVLQEILPAVRGDLAMSRQRLIGKDKVIPCPITAVAGSQDDIYSPEMLSEWYRHSQDFRLLELPGGHLFIHEQVCLKKLIEIIYESFC